LQDCRSRSGFEIEDEGLGMMVDFIHLSSPLVPYAMPSHFLDLYSLILSSVAAEAIAAFPEP
jgi:hypothetical protein